MPVVANRPTDLSLSQDVKLLNDDESQSDILLVGEVE